MNRKERLNSLKYRYGRKQMTGGAKAGPARGVKGAGSRKDAEGAGSGNPGPGGFGGPGRFDGAVCPLE